jgi:hypothetical protein
MIPQRATCTTVRGSLLGVFGRQCATMTFGRYMLCMSDGLASLVLYAHRSVISGLMFGIPIGPPGSYLTLSLRNLGYVRAVGSRVYR